MRRTGRIIAVAAALAVSPLGVLATQAQPAPAPVLSSSMLLERLSTPSRWDEPMPDGGRIVQHSSHDRSGGNGDGGFFDPVSEARGAATYLRRDGDRFVLFEEHHPGCLTRMQFTGLDPAPGGMGDWGTLHFRFDDATELAADARSLFHGDVPGFPSPLVGDAAVSSGGNYSYVPLCFSRSLVVEAERPTPGLGFFQLTAVVLPDGSPVETWHLDEAAVDVAAAALRDPGAPPSVAPATAGDGRLHLDGSGRITYLRISLPPAEFATESLRARRLQVSVDGAPPQIDVSLAAAFGDGLEATSLRSAAFGMDPAGGVGYVALPIPFRDGIDVVVTGSSRATIEVWRDHRRPGDRTLHAETRHETTAVGEDYRVLDTGGAGHLVAWTLDIVGQHGSAIQPTYLEGDMRLFVDGSRSPSVYGTGTEDEFNGGFYYVNGAFSLPTHGAGPRTTVDDRSTQSQYRLFPNDPPSWTSAIRFQMEHGASDEDVREVASTTWSYREPATSSDGTGLPLGSESMWGYFEGDHDGNVAVPLAPLGLVAFAPPPESSPEGVQLHGLRFSTPLSFRTGSRPGCALVLRRVRDAATTTDLEVTVDGAVVGRWRSAYTNGSKRWDESDYWIPGSLVRRPSVRVTLAPRPGAVESAFDLRTRYACP